jgi:hypothetical protein
MHTVAVAWHAPLSVSHAGKRANIQSYTVGVEPFNQAAMRDKEPLAGYDAAGAPQGVEGCVRLRVTPCCAALHRVVVRQAAR